MRKARSPVFAAWHLFSDLPEKDFAARAAEVPARVASLPGV